MLKPTVWQPSSAKKSSSSSGRLMPSAVTTAITEKPMPASRRRRIPRMLRLNAGFPVRSTRSQLSAAGPSTLTPIRNSRSAKKSHQASVTSVAFVCT